VFTHVKGYRWEVVMAQPTVMSRRDRVRAATVEEIKETARRILVAEGTDGLSLRAIAREMGMTAPALYRYFASREDLLVALITDLYDEMADTMEAARDAEPEDDVPARLAAASRTFRSWAVGHPREFGLLFGSPIPGVEMPEEEDGGGTDAGRRLGEIFGELLARLYLERPFPIPADDEIDATLRGELAEWARELPPGLPLGLAQVFLSCWIRIYGTVAMEVFGHLTFAVSDGGPMFEAELRELAGRLGFDYEPPATAAGR
jgi:AcrR family transcriptional regulator